MGRLPIRRAPPLARPTPRPVPTSTKDARVNWLEPTVSWYLTTTAAALAFAPLVMLTFRHVTDRGASLIRPLGLLALVWPVWFLASIGDGVVPFGRVTLWVALALIAVVAWVAGLRAGAVDREAIQHLAIAEAGYLALFAVLVWLRGYIPAVGGPNTIDQEKPMDLMMLASSMKATAMPPLDAWLSGETINYYYLGYAIWAAIGKMIGTSPAIAYNLALVSTVAMTIVAVLGTVANILSRFVAMTTARVGGLLGVALVVLIGNPWAAWHIVDDLDAQWRRWPFDGVMWNATRIIPVSPTDFAISEFPAFSFLFADMHPHVMAIPFAVTALGLAWMFVTLPRDSSAGARLPRLLLAGVAVTALYAINSWDFPTWFAVVALGMLISPGFPGLGQRLAGIAIALVAGVAAWSPFLLAFEAPVKIGDTAFAERVSDIPVVGELLASIGAWTGDRTSAGDYLAIFGFFYPVLVAVILIELIASGGDDDPLVTRLAVITSVALAVLGVVLPAPVLLLAGLPMLAGLVVLLRATNVTLELIVVGLATLAFALTIVPEFFFLLDAFGNRMNTIFKLYLQVWLLSGVAAALGLVCLWERARAWRPGQAVVAVAGAAIVLLGLTYPVVAASQWVQVKNPELDWEGMDGLAWLDDSSAADPATHDALLWLWEHGDNDDVLLAAAGCAYRAPVGFPAAASGVPAIVGWDNHERQWHLSDPAIMEKLTARTADVNALFTEPTTELLDRYGVTLIYLGRPETQGVSGVEPSATCAPGPFPKATAPGFPGAGWTEVFSEDGVRILRRNAAG
jgi:YYY domain-containing protein